jgi:hypothetical protein
MNLSPARPKRQLGTPAFSALTPRTKARKRMRGEEVPTTPGDKRRKLASAVTATATDTKDKVPQPLFGEPRGTKRPSSDNDDDGDDEIMNSPRKKSAVGTNGRVFTSVFDDTAGDEETFDRDLSSPRKVTFAFSDAETEEGGAESLRSTPPPPPSESGDSHAPDEGEEDLSENNDNSTPPAVATSIVRGKPPNPILPGRWTQDSWDAPVAGTDLSHLRKNQFGKTSSAPEKAKAKGKAKPGDKTAKTDKERLANPFELLPPIPGDEGTSKSTSRGTKYGEGRGKAKGKDAESVAALKKRAKEAEAETDGMDQGESSDVDERVVEIAWRPHGPLRSTPSATTPLPNNPAANDDDENDEQADPAHNLPSDLRSLLSIHSTRRDETKEEALADDVLAGRARASGVAEVWGVGDLGEWEGGERDGEEGDWESEPEGWTGGVEM